MVLKIRLCLCCFPLLFLKMFVSNEICPIKGKDLGWGTASSVLKKRKRKKENSQRR